MMIDMFNSPDNIVSPAPAASSAKMATPGLRMIRKATIAAINHKPYAIWSKCNLVVLMRQRLSLPFYK